MVNPDTNKEENERHIKLTYDAIEDIYNSLEVGMSVYVRGNIQVEEYTAQNGEKRNTTRLIPNQISLTGSPIDFNAEDFKEQAVFELGVIAEDIEFSGTEEATITGLFLKQQMQIQKYNHYIIYEETPTTISFHKWIAILIYLYFCSRIF